MKKKIIDVFKERWIYYTGGYILVYIMSISIAFKNNIMSGYFLFPIRLFPITLGLLIGTALYYGANREPIFYSTARIIKYVVALIILFVIAEQVRQLLITQLQIDITPFVSVP